MQQEAGAVLTLKLRLMLLSMMMLLERQTTKAAMRRCCRSLTQIAS